MGHPAICTIPVIPERSNFLHNFLFLPVKHRRFQHILLKSYYSYQALRTVDGLLYQRLFPTDITAWFYKVNRLVGSPTSLTNITILIFRFTVRASTDNETVRKKTVIMSTEELFGFPFNNQLMFFIFFLDKLRISAVFLRIGGIEKIEANIKSGIIPNMILSYLINHLFRGESIFVC